MQVPKWYVPKDWCNKPCIICFPCFNLSHRPCKKKTFGQTCWHIAITQIWKMKNDWPDFLSFFHWKKQSSTLPRMPSKETVKQELKLIAGALLKGSRSFGSKSFMIKTPALAALQCVYMMMSNSLRLQTCCLPGTVLSHHVAKSLNVHLTIHPENMNPFTCSVQAVNHADEGQAFFFWVTK